MKFSHLVDLCEMPLPILDIKGEPLTKLPDGTYTGIGRFNCRVFALDADETKYHRVDGPAVDCSRGGNIYQEWWLNGQRHRVGGPAFIQAEHEEWWLNGQRHRIGGPAFDQYGHKQWWVEGAKLTEEDYNDLMKRLSTLTDDSDRAATIAAATMFD